MKNNKNDKGDFFMKKNLAAVIISVMFFGIMMVISIGIGMKIHAQNKEIQRAEYREAIESAYISDIRMVMEENGYSNSGVNMTKVTNEDGEWEYNVVIYHHSFAWMEEGAKEEMKIRLTDMGSDDLGKISLAFMTR